MPNPAADPTADTAAAMLQALRSADMNNQPLAEGLVDALDELLARSLEPVRIANRGKPTDVVLVDDICSVIYHLRNNNS